MGGNRKLIGVTSVYIFFVYAFSTMVLEWIYLATKEILPLLPLRAVIYVIVCYIFEFSSGYVLKKFDLCPWDYESFFHFHIMGLITFEYLPVWYVASILGEYIVIRMHLVVVGGGIAGVNCMTQLLAGARSPDDRFTLVSASPHVKTVTNWFRVGQFTEYFNVTESSAPLSTDPRYTFLQANATGFDKDKQIVQLDNGNEIKYDRLCIATGARPKCPWKHEKLVTLRDTETALSLQEKLAGAKRVALIGNGGIATELIFELRDVEVTWIIRDEYISATFFQSDVVEFFNKQIEQGRVEGHKNAGVLKREKYRTDERIDVDAGDEQLASTSTGQSTGCALGPDWCTALTLKGTTGGHRNVKIISGREVVGVSGDGELKLQLSGGEQLECDIAIVAIGVEPNSQLWKGLDKSDIDEGILVDESLRTSNVNVYACGDVCTVNWKQQSSMWKQMRLWTQARQMGDLCGRSMISGGQVELDMCFELFAHVTTFFGYKVANFRLPFIL
ncbi:hypothetical protein WR25_15434 isoform B [Diploscapter pachys]|uniref:FAD/NAD(P)-binding domain-containing protein n=1 Tax=Diploscapter pachys TaxID=2018661 RepID=A0A2A2JF66_9BILA|nr:hypothetical protein WR25_15434 isoform B [Diploscapter pachys]